jgi:hypothetical protein
VAAATGLVKIAEGYPEARAARVAAIGRVLERHAENDEALNGSLISDLIDPRAVEAAPIIERAFAAESADETVAGDWEDVQVALGLLAERVTPRPHRPLLPWGRDAVVSRGDTTRPLVFDDGDGDRLPERGQSPGRAKEARKAKSKRKMAAQSLRQNKKRK